MNRIEIYSTASNSRDIGIDIVDTKTGNGLILFRGKLEGNKSEEGFRKAVLAQFPKAISALRVLSDPLAQEWETTGARIRAKALLAVIDQNLN